MILASLQKPSQECSIKLIFASVALGMGADLKNVKRVIHAGPPSTLESKILIYFILYAEPLVTVLFLKLTDEIKFHLTH